MRDNKTILVVAGLATAGIWAGVYLSLHNGFSPALAARPHQALGWLMARQAAAYVKGGQIIVIARDTSAFANPASDIQLASFGRSLHESGLAIGSLHLLRVDPLRPLEVPAGDFLELIRKSPPGSVIVSFMGPPCLTEDQCRQLGNTKPAIVAYCPGMAPANLALQSWLRAGLMQAALLDRRDVIPAALSASDLKTYSAQRFLTLTAADSAQAQPSNQTQP